MSTTFAVWHIAGPVLSWYLVLQLITLAVLPAMMRLFSATPDRGYGLAKIAGVLAVGLTLWLGVSYGLLRNDVGGAWLAVAAVTAASLWFGRPVLAAWRRRHFGLSWRYVLGAEALFAGVYLTWALVRAYDPAANHTEQPMDLMFMNSIWSSATYPPRDAWLSGYAISYYYLGYWLLTTLGRLAGQPPAVAYNVGQACWYGLLLLGSFSVAYNLLATAPGLASPGAEEVPAAGAEAGGQSQGEGRSAALGGLLAALAVGVTGNLQGILEWLHAVGVGIAPLARWFGVYNFPAAGPDPQSGVTGQWFIGFDWWWWRSSRVVQDLDLLGRHVEVIDEFPSFSYLLGDNHPHVLAMPVVLLVIGFAFNLLRAPVAGAPAATELRRHWRWPWEITPGGGAGFGAMLAASGALIFLNTWDYPPYWLLLVICSYVAARRHQPADERQAPAVLTAAIYGGVLMAGTFLLYLPYFLSAQSQAGGLLPNLFNPTRLPQFVLMFGFALAGVLALICVVWEARRPARRDLLVAFGLVFGLPLLWLAVALLAVTGTEAGRRWLDQLPLPPGAAGHLSLIAQRWSGQAATFLVVGALLALVAALAWRHLQTMLAAPARSRTGGPVAWPAESMVCALLLAGLGLLWVYIPEFAYLRDNFGTRMNTVFKFYYQGWLLLSLATAYGVTHALRTTGSGWAPKAAGIVSLLLILAGLVYPVAGVYSKTGGFVASQPTLDATAYIVASAPDEADAIAWVNANVAPGAVVLEGKGASYQSVYNRISAATGHPTLLGWDGHQSQWRGEAYGRQALGRPEAIAAVYRDARPEEVARLLDEWNISYVYIGPTERRDYGITAANEERLAAAMDLVFAQGDVRIYRRRAP